MNIADSTWIPIMLLDGTRREASLADIFREGEKMADLALRPHERIAVMRLLVCLAQAALDGPDDENDWDEAGERLPKAALEYLEKWRARFELFGDGTRFLQCRADEMSEFETSKLLFDRACGNNPTVFDNEGGSSRRLTPQDLALALLCFQNMSAPIGAGYTGKAPCLDRHFLQTWLIGDNLLRTILANGVDRQAATKNFPAGLGRPIWEDDVRFDDEAFRRNVTLSFLGRLVPVTRRVWLNSDGLGFEMAKAGISHPTFEEFRESAATVRTISKKGSEARFLLAASAEKQPWRDLQHIVQARQNEKPNRPLALQRSEPAPFRRLWLGALLTDGKAKYEETVEAVYDVPRELLCEDRQPIYAQGIAFADAWRDLLCSAVSGYAAALKMQPERTRAERRFWNSLDQHVPELMEVVRNVSLLEGKTFWKAQVPWTGSVRRAAFDAYQYACPCETPRQIQAFTVGLNKLRPPKPRKETE